MEGVWKDLSYSFRMLRKSPAFTVVAVATLALGIGATTAIFSVVNAVLLRPLPYINPGRHVVALSGSKRESKEQYYGAAPADFWDWQAQTRAFEQLAGYSGGGFTFTGVAEPESFPSSRVSTNFFQAFNARPLLGRTFAPEDGLLGAPKTIILSHRLWQRRFGGDPNIIGQTLGDTGVTVVGVMPADFKYPATAEVWTPLPRDSGEMRNRANRYFQVVGLLRPGVTLEQGEAELQTIAANLEAAHPETNKEYTVLVLSLRDYLAREVKRSLLILLGAVGFVLMIACANVAGLLLARAAGRRKEVAIRLALGASRRRIVRQLLTESLLLSLAGGTLGLLCALWGIDLLLRLLPQSYAYLQLQEQARIDGTVLVFTLLATILTGLIFGLVPAWQAARPEINEWLKEGGRGPEGALHQRARGGLVIAEVALAVMLLVGAGLLVQSLVRLQRADLGFDPRSLLPMGISITFRNAPNDAARLQFVKQMVERVATTPGVEAVTVTSYAAFPYLHFDFNIEGRPLPAPVDAVYDAVGANYFRVMRASMAAGREFTERDSMNSPPVAIINETLARRYFAGLDPLGQRITINYYSNTRQTREIVGVVKDINQGEGGRILPQIYVAYEQQPWLSAGLLMRTTIDPEAVRKDVQRAIWAVDKSQAASKLDSPAVTLGQALAEPRLYTLLLSAFAALALLLAAIGIYGLLAYAVAQRTREIGVRMALGARPRDVLRLVLGQGMRLALAGVALGLAGSFALARVMASLLYGVTPTDPATYAAIALLLANVAFLACYLPARRATRVDPLVALRQE